MGCANAKPQVHTKKPPLQSNSNINQNSQSQSLRNSQPIQNSQSQNVNHSQPIQYPSLSPIPSKGKQNVIPPIQQQNNSFESNPKSNLSDIQKNPYLTREQVRQQIASKTQQTSHLSQKKADIQPQTNNNNLGQDTNQQIKKPVQPVLSQPKKQQNQGQPLFSSFENHSNQQVTQQQTPVKKQSVSKPFESSPKINNMSGNSNALSTIKQRRQESQMTKHLQPSLLVVQNKKDELRASGSIFSSGDTPRMDDNCLVSNISKESKVSPLKTIVEKESDNKVKESQEVNREKVSPKIQRQQNANLKPLSTNKIQNGINGSPSRLSNSPSNKKQPAGTTLFENNQITSDEIKISLTTQKKPGNSKLHESDFWHENELIIPMEENFELSCGFQVNKLIVDMSKIVW